MASLSAKKLATAGQSPGPPAALLRLPHNLILHKLFAVTAHLHPEPWVHCPSISPSKQQVSPWIEVCRRSEVRLRLLRRRAQERHRTVLRIDQASQIRRQSRPGILQRPSSGIVSREERSQLHSGSEARAAKFPWASLSPAHVRFESKGKRAPAAGRPR